MIADADDGYGNPLNVMRTVREYEAAGVAGLHLEDQVAPKRCGHMDGKEVIAASEMAEKVRAAVEARRSPELVIIARTDARAVEGLDGALERARRYRDAGADMLFVEAPESEDEIAAVADAFPDTPLLFNWVEGGKTPALGLDRIRELGFRLVIYPVTTLLVASHAVGEALARLRDDGTPAAIDVPGFDAFTAHDRPARRARARVALRRGLSALSRAEAPARPRSSARARRRSASRRARRPGACGRAGCGAADGGPPTPATPRSRRGPGRRGRR